MARGMLTEQMKEKYGITNTELRLIPYFQYLLVNHMPVDPAKITAEERTILQNWRDAGKITFSCTGPVTASKEFWDFMNEVLWDAYVPHMELEEKEYDRE